MQLSNFGSGKIKTYLITERVKVGTLIYTIYFDYSECSTKDLFLLKHPLV
jgi:hypothetical protein